MRAPKTSDVLIDGFRWPKKARAEFERIYADLDWDAAWVDLGPSPAGNPGPYFKVPRKSEPDIVHRVYPIRRCLRVGLQFAVDMGVFRMAGEEQPPATNTEDSGHTRAADGASTPS